MRSRGIQHGQHTTTGITGGFGGQIRRSRFAVEAGRCEIVTEKSCNGMTSIGHGTTKPPDSNNYFRRASADLTFPTRKLGAFYDSPRAALSPRRAPRSIVWSTVMWKNQCQSCKGRKKTCSRGLRCFDPRNSPALFHLVRPAYSAILSIGALRPQHRRCISIEGSRQRSLSRPRCYQAPRRGGTDRRGRDACYHGDRWRTHQQCWNRVCGRDACASVRRWLVYCFSTIRNLILL